MALRGKRGPKRSVGGKRPAKRSGGKRMARKVGGRRQTGAPKRQLIQANLGGLSLTRFTANRKPSAVAAHIKRVGASNYLNVTYPGIAQSLGGFQAYSSWYLNCRNDLQRIWASIQGAYITNNPTTGVPVPTTIAGNINKPAMASFRFVLESAVSMLHMANTSGTPLNLEIYDVVAKRDSGTLGWDLSGNKLSGLSTGLGFMDPSIAWYLGMNNQSSNPTGWDPSLTLLASDPSNLGATPYNSKLFKDYFKVVRKTNVSLPIGGQHKHYVDLKPNFVVDQDLMSQNAVYKGTSYFTLVVAGGVPVVTCPAAPGQLGGDVSTSAVSLSLLQNVKYKWTWAEDSRENVYRVNYIDDTKTGHQSIQPAMNKVTNAANFGQFATYDGIDGVYTSLPSECTRAEPPLVAATDCGC